ncbi:MAG TPA: DegT/DnrJ/EryC1/StrS family aminotransferase, partial [Anaerovoracaceae bacterium]|nr:DegT/DnrJ/EryC1/StrS family aminotransferase [Anaerovoracaceae bacterium]
DLQAFLGMRQLQKLDQVVDKRNRNYAYFNKHIKTNFWKPKQPDADNERFVSNMGYPIIHPKRNVIVGLCKEHAIEVRPLISGTMGKQPFYRNMLGKTVALRNADFVDQYGMYIPNHACLTDVEMETMCNIINKITGYE